MNRYHWNAVLGTACCLFALVLLLVWIPADVASGVIEQVRRQVVIGDAMAPTVWSIGIGVLGLLLLLASLGLGGCVGAAVGAGAVGGIAIAQERSVGNAIDDSVIIALSHWSKNAR